MAIHINDYSFGRIMIGGEVYDKDLILLPDRVIPNWWRREGHRLSADDLGEVISAAPRKLVIGTGAFGMMRVPRETLDHLMERGIKVEVLKTKDACERFNEAAEKMNTAAALHLSC
jgi:hypothetical protein